MSDHMQSFHENSSQLDDLLWQLADLKSRQEVSEAAGVFLSGSQVNMLSLPRKVWLDQTKGFDKVFHILRH